MSTEPTTTGHIRALADAIRDGELSPAQREHLVTLLHSLNTAATLAPQAQEIYPDCDSRALGYLIGAWAPVQRDFADLAATVRPSGEKHAA